jgi:serine/threonine protein kinase
MQQRGAGASSAAAAAAGGGASSQHASKQQQHEHHPPATAAPAAGGEGGSWGLEQHYDLLGKIGEGTYGIVYLATAKHDKKQLFAIKKFKTGRVSRLGWAGVVQPLTEGGQGYEGSLWCL